MENEKTTKEDIDSRWLAFVSAVHRILLGSLQISSSSTLQALSLLLRRGGPSGLTAPCREGEVVRYMGKIEK
jgi:hypothetical protein